MSAFSTVGDVFADQSLRHLATRSCGALEDSNRECTGFLIMPKRPYEWCVDSHGCYKFINADLALRPRDTTAHFLVFTTSTHQLPGP